MITVFFEDLLFIKSQGAIIKLTEIATIPWIRS